MPESIEDITRERNQLRADNERLLKSNDLLAKRVIGVSTWLEESKRDLMAHGWDQCAEFVFAGDNTAEKPWVKENNPFRKPIDTGDTE